MSKAAYHKGVKSTLLPAAFITELHKEMSSGLCKSRDGEKQKKNEERPDRVLRTPFLHSQPYAIAVTHFTFMRV